MSNAMETEVRSVLGDKFLKAKFVPNGKNITLEILTKDSKEKITITVDQYLAIGRSVRK